MERSSSVAPIRSCCAWVDGTRRCMNISNWSRALKPDDDDLRKIDGATLRRLLRYSLSYPRLLKQAAALLLLSTLGQVMGPVLVKIFLDDYVTAGEYPEIGRASCRERE